MWSSSKGFTKFMRGLWVSLGLVCGQALAQVGSPSVLVTPDPVEGAEAEEAVPAPDPLAETGPVALDPRRSQLQALLTELPDTQQVGLPLGEQDFYALYQPHHAAKSLGGVLLVHDVGQHGDWPRLIRPLRQGLALYGWSTLSLNLQDPPDRDLPPRELPDKGELFHLTVADQSPPAEPAPTGADLPMDSELPVEDDAMIQLQETVPPPLVRTPQMIFEEQAFYRLGAGIAYLRQLIGDELVIVGVGDSARLSALQLTRHPELRGNQGITLVWINARLKPEEQGDLSRLFGKPPYPRLLDVVDSSDGLQTQPARERLGSAKRLGMEQYEQIRLPLHLHGAIEQDQALVQRVHTWLKAHLHRRQGG